MALEMTYEKNETGSSIYRALLTWDDPTGTQHFLEFGTIEKTLVETEIGPVSGWQGCFTTEPELVKRRTKKAVQSHLEKRVFEALSLWAQREQHSVTSGSTGSYSEKENLENVA